MLTQVYNIIIDHGVAETIHGREVVDGLDDIAIFFLSMLMITVKLSSASGYNRQMNKHTSTLNKEINISMEPQKNLSCP